MANKVGKCVSHVMVGEQCVTGIRVSLSDSKAHTQTHTEQK